MCSLEFYSNVFKIIHTTTKMYSYITCTSGEADGPAVNPDELEDVIHRNKA